MKTIYRLVVMMVAAVALLALSMPVYASKTDSRIESSAKKSYVFKTYLKGDDIKIQSRDGAVTLTGTVAEESTNHWPKRPSQTCPVSRAWTTSWKSKVKAPLKTRMHGSLRKLKPCSCFIGT